MSATLRLALRLAALAPAFLLGVPAQALAGRIAPGLTRTLPVLFHRYILRVLGVRLRLEGAPPAGAALIVANHISWLDIPVLASLRPLSFIAKSEVAGWTGFGALARLQNSVFVERQRRHATGAATGSIAGRLARGDVMVLFAEGTTSDGHRVLPFRSALIGAAWREEEAGPPLSVVPLAIRYCARDGLPLTRRDMPEIAWYGDMELLPHLCALLRAGPVDVVLAFGQSIALTDARDRKNVAVAAERWCRCARRRAIGFEDSANCL